jgi:hypothetical protein
LEKKPARAKNKKATGKQSPKSLFVLVVEVEFYE